MRRLLEADLALPAQVPIWEVHFPTDLGWLPALLEAITRGVIDPLVGSP